jgi:hypothetical protein
VKPVKADDVQWNMHEKVEPRKNKKRNQETKEINTCIIQEEFGAGVHIAVIECYIIHSNITEQFTLEMKNDILLLIGNLTLNLTEIQELKLREAREGPTALLSLQIEGKRGEIRENLDALPTMEFLDTLSLEPTPDIFLETLILCVKNNALQE